MNCPTCTSDNTQRQRITYEAGTPSTSENSAPTTSACAATSNPGSVTNVAKCGAKKIIPPQACPHQHNLA
jgi:hypothetical protein